MQLKQMVHFAKKMEITHVGEGVLKKLFNSGINTIPKLLSIKKSDLLKIDGIQEKGAEKIYESIKSRIQNTDCLNLMIASNIFGKGFGERKLKLFVDAHPEILEGKKISVLKKIEGVGEITGTQFLKHLPEFYEFLKEIGYVCKKPEVESSSLDSSDSDEMVFNDMTIVFTGFRNKEWENRIVKLGGKIGSAISKNTALLVVADKDDTSSKIIKAKELGITILDKNTFVKTYKNNNFI
jgi:NAD-dependent DNA ligase